MTTVQIKNWYTGAVIREAPALPNGSANLCDADLSSANLIGADLSRANLIGAVMPDGATWETYLAETVPALLTVGGKPLAAFADAWECHDWRNCPMAHAFDVAELTNIPALYRPRAAEFIQFFDARLIPWSAIEAAIEAEEAHV